MSASCPIPHSPNGNDVGREGFIWLGQRWESQDNIVLLLVFGMTENIKPEATYLSYPHIPSTSVGIPPQPWAVHSGKHSTPQPLLCPETQIALTAWPFLVFSSYLLFVNRNQLNLIFHNIYMNLSDAKVLFSYFYVVSNTGWCDRLKIDRYLKLLQSYLEVNIQHSHLYLCDVVKLIKPFPHSKRG